MHKPAVIAAVLTLFAGPAVAAEYYVAQNPTTKTCRIVEEKPDGEKLVMIGTTSYATEDEAKAARKAADECEKRKKAEREKKKEKEAN